MVTINLQWLAYPLWLVAAWMALRGLGLGLPLLFKTDIAPLIGMQILISRGGWGLGLAVLGWLVWRAFRP